MLFLSQNFLLIVSFSLSSVFMNAHARGLYLNGKDISGARDENLESVRVKIDSKGDIWISGERYRVETQEHFVPVEKKSDVAARLPKEVKDINVTKNISEDKNTPDDPDEPKSVVAKGTVEGDSLDPVQKVQISQPRTPGASQSSDGLKQQPADIHVKESIDSKEAVAK